MEEEKERKTMNWNENKAADLIENYAIQNGYDSDSLEDMQELTNLETLMDLVAELEEDFYFHYDTEYGANFLVFAPTGDKREVPDESELNLYEILSWAVQIQEKK